MSVTVSFVCLKYLVPSCKECAKNKFPQIWVYVKFAYKHGKKHGSRCSPHTHFSSFWFGFQSMWQWNAQVTNRKLKFATNMSFYFIRVIMMKIKGITWWFTLHILVVWPTMYTIMYESTSSNCPLCIHSFTFSCG